MLCLVALSLGKGSDRAGEVAVADAGTTTVAAPPSGELAPALVPVGEDRGRLQIVAAPKYAPVPKAAVEPLFQADERVKIGETTKLRFAVKDRASGLPQSLEQVSASVTHGK